MTTCPNCGKLVGKDDDVCKNCGFNLKKYRDDFFTDNYNIEKDDEPDAAGKVTSRAAYRREFYPTKQNTVVQKMIAWVRANATIVFLLGVLLLIIMSFSRPLGWLSFFGLMAWLFIVCERSQKIEQCTADRRLTEKVNQVGSNVFNSIESGSSKIRSKGQKFEENHPKVEKDVKKVKESRLRNFGYVQLSVVLTAFISLIVMFSGSGAEGVGGLYQQRVSISKLLLDFAGRLLSGQNSGYAAVVYVVWLLLILFPIWIIYNILKNNRSSQFLAFILSLIETIFLCYLIYRLSSVQRADTGVLSQLTSQLLTYAISIGASAYFLVISSIMTTVLSAYNLFRRRHNLDK